MRAGPATWLRTHGLSKSYEGVAAVRDVSIVVSRGEIHGLVGANGAGKSTLVRLLAGAARPDAGSIEVDGQLVRLGRPADARRLGIEVMPQELTVAGHLTVAENVMLGRFPRGWLGTLSAARTKALANRALDLLKLDIDVDAPVASLSVLEQRLVMAARAVAADARLVMLDEPTAGMPPPDVKLVLDGIRRLAARGIACLYVSHHLDEIVDTCDRVTAMRDGSVIAELSGSQTTHAALVDLISPTDAAPARRQGALRSSDGGPLLRVRELRGRRLHDAAFEVAGGEIVGIAGLAGSGAKELLLTIAGANRAEAGQVEVDGRPLRLGNRQAAVAAGIGYLPGERALGVLPRQSVRSNVSLPILRQLASLGFVRRRRENDTVESLAERVALNARVDTPIARLSGGNQQKALVARWIGCSARVLLLDDPTAGVDVAARAEIHGEVVRLCRESGLAVLVTSTDLDELAELSDRVLVLQRGRLVQEIERPHGSAQILAEMTRGADRAVEAAVAR